MFQFLKKYKNEIFISSLSSTSTTTFAVDIFNTIKDRLKNISNIEGIKNALNIVSNNLNPRNILLNGCGINTDDENTIDDQIANLLNNHLFPIKDFSSNSDIQCDNNTGVYYHFYNNTKKTANNDTLIVCCHGISNDILNFIDSQKNISEVFNCDSLSLEYNFFNNNGSIKISDIRRMIEMAEKMFNFLSEFLKNNKQYKVIIFYGYSHGNLYTLNIFKDFISLNYNNYTFKYIGDKGYCNLSQALNVIIKSKINIDNNNKFFNFLNVFTSKNVLDHITIFLLGRNLYETIIRQSNNYETLNSIKSKIKITHNKLKTKGHTITKEGSKEIADIFNKSENNIYNCFLFSASNDDIVGNGFEQIYNYLNNGDVPKNMDYNTIYKEFSNCKDEKIKKDEKGEEGKKGEKDEKEKKQKSCCLFS